MTVKKPACLTDNGAILAICPDMSMVNLCGGTAAQGGKTSGRIFGA
jgi:hypothetical protein